MSRYGVTVQPIPLHFGAATSFSPVAPVAGGGGGGGGWGVLVPLIPLLLAPLLAAGPHTAPTAAPPPPPEIAVGTLVPPAAGTNATSGPVGVASSPSLPAVLPLPVPGPSQNAVHQPSAGPHGIVVLSGGPTLVKVARPPQSRVSAVGHRRGPNLPFTGEELWLPAVVGLELVSVGALLRWALRASRRRGTRSRP